RARREPRAPVGGRGHRRRLRSGPRAGRDRDQAARDARRARRDRPDRPRRRIRPPSAGARNKMTAAVQTIWAELVATSLPDAGVTRCVVSPGSRSTPLVAALAREARLELTTLIDERTAAFFALGAARATGAPIALVCTSGTAAAHYLPAIIEASMAGVPLIALTTDRPPRR